MHKFGILCEKKTLRLRVNRRPNFEFQSDAILNLKQSKRLEEKHSFDPSFVCKIAYHCIALCQEPCPVSKTKLIFFEEHLVHSNIL